MSPKLKSLIPDADAIIHLHELGLWSRLCNRTRVLVPSIVAREVKYYRDLQTGERVPIDLQQQRDQQAITEVTATAIEVAQFLAQFDAVLSDELHEGELEALTCLAIHAGQDCRFCTADKAAIRALVLAGMAEKGISLEKALRWVGHTVPELRHQHSEARFRALLKEASVQRIQGTGLTGSKWGQ